MTNKSKNKPVETEQLESFAKGEGSKSQLEDSLLQSYHIFNSLENTISWVKLGLENKEEAKQRLKEGENPDPRFSKPDVDGSNVRTLIEHVESISRSLDPSMLKNLGLTALTPEDVAYVLENTCRSYRAYLQIVEDLAADNFTDPSRSIWGLPDPNLGEQNIGHLEQNGYDHRPEGSLGSQKVKSLFVDEVERLGFEWDVEIKNTNGCFNDVTEQKLVVADGSEEKRLYTEKEARLLAKHEVFHAARAFNGSEVVGSTDFPEFTKLNTGFYDKTEEGGAVHAEFCQLDVPKWRKDDYVVKQACCSLLQEFSPVDVFEKLVGFGVPEDRAADLVLMNMTRLRHHVYLEGTAEWTEAHPMMMVGKANTCVAGVVWKEVVNGSFERPAVSVDDVFS